MVVHAHYPLGESRVERQARALIDCGYEVDVICLRGGGELAYEKVNGVNIYRLPVKRHKGSGLFIQLFEYLSFFFLAFYRLLRLYPRRRYGVVQVHNLPDFLIFSALVAKLGGARLILDLHDLMPEFFAASFGRDMKSWPVRLLVLQEQVSCLFADHVITVTETWRETLIRRGVPPGKVTVVMNVADSHIFYPLQTMDRPEKTNGNFNLIYHGALARRYGLDLLIQAIEMVRSRIHYIHLTIHGVGEFHQDLVELVEGLNLRNHVSFSTHLLPISELPGLIRKAELGVVPYRSDLFTDGILPTKMMEYVALNIPVVAARTPAITAYFDETMVQFFTPGSVEELANCILSLHKDRAQLARLAENEKKFNQEYTWEKVARDYVALVDHLSD